MHTPAPCSSPGELRSKRATPPQSDVPVRLREKPALTAVSSDSCSSRPERERALARAQPIVARLAQPIEDCRGELPYEEDQLPVRARVPRPFLTAQTPPPPALHAPVRTSRAVLASSVLGRRCLGVGARTPTPARPGAAADVHAPALARPCTQILCRSPAPGLCMRPAQRRHPHAPSPPFARSRAAEISARFSARASLRRRGPGTSRGPVRGRATGRACDLACALRPQQGSHRAALRRSAPAAGDPMGARRVWRPVAELGSLTCEAVSRGVF